MSKDELLQLLKDEDVQAAVRQIVIDGQPEAREVMREAERLVRRRLDLRNRP